MSSASSSSQRQASSNNSNGNNTNTKRQRSRTRPKTKLKLRIPSKNPYGKIIQDAEGWPPRDDLYDALRAGPTAIRNWQTHQIEELIVPHLNGQQINQIIQKLGFEPSKVFEKIHQKLLFEFLHHTLQSTLHLHETSMRKKKLLNILRHSLRFIRIHHFKQLNIEILSRIDVIPKAVLRILCDYKNQDLLCDFPINIKRQIWSHKLQLFDAEFDNILFQKYILASSYFEHIYAFNPLMDDYLEIIKIKRANNETLKEMVNDIGSCAVLFHRFSANIEKYFIASLDTSRIDDDLISWRDLIHLSTFRIDVSCSLFDHAHKLLVTELDPIWNLIRIIYYRDHQPIMREMKKNEIDCIYKALFITNDGTRAKSLQLHCVMFLCIPYVKSLLFASYIALLEDIAHKQILPRDSKSLSLLTQILSVAVAPNKRLRDTSTASGYDDCVLFQFNPLLTANIYLDSLHLDLDDINNTICEEYPLNPDLVKWSKESPLCAYIFIYYLLWLIRKRRMHRFLQFMDIAIANEFDASYLFAMNAFTEIHLICDAVTKWNQEINCKDTKWTTSHKCKFVEFLICFVSQTKHDAQIIEPITNIIQNIGLFKGDSERFIAQLNQ